MCDQQVIFAVLGLRVAAWASRDQHSVCTKGILEFWGSTIAERRTRNDGSTDDKPPRERVPVALVTTNLQGMEVAWPTSGPDRRAVGISTAPGKRRNLACPGLPSTVDQPKPRAASDLQCAPKNSTRAAIRCAGATWCRNVILLKQRRDTDKRHLSNQMRPVTCRRPSAHVAALCGSPDQDRGVAPPPSPSLVCFFFWILPFASSPHPWEAGRRKSTWGPARPGSQW